MFILDTNVISELRHGKPRQSPEVRAWAAAQPGSRLFLSAITVLELEMGVQALERRTPPQGSALRSWLTGVRAAFAGRILPFTENTAPVCAALHIPAPFRARRYDCRHRHRAWVYRGDAQCAGFCAYQGGGFESLGWVSESGFIR